MADGLHRWFWPEGVALSGLAAFGEHDFVRNWVAARITAKPAIVHVNDVTPAAAGAATGFTAELGPYVDWVMSAPRAASGAIEHWPGGLWADTMFMAGAFLCRLGRSAGDEALIEEAGRQYLLHAQVLQDEATGLFAHGSHRGETIWCFWGRANAWAALAGVELLEVGGGSARDEIAQRLERQLSALAERQPEHGVWDVLVDGRPETAGILETSSAAGLGAAMLRAGQLQAGQFKAALSPAITDAGWRAVGGALAYVDDDGYLTRVSAGTILQLIPFGYSVIRSDRPQLYGQGLALTAVAAALGAAR
jgi:unsaturated rhamnogalacturonyl hydrolase